MLKYRDCKAANAIKGDKKGWTGIKYLGIYTGFTLYILYILYIIEGPQNFDHD